MQGYKKNEMEREFATKVEEFLIEKKVFFVKMYGDEVNIYSNPDYICCINGRFVAIELNNYTQDPNLSFSKDKMQRIIRSKGTLLLVDPTNFEAFKDTVTKDLESHCDFRRKNPKVFGKRPGGNDRNKKKPQYQNHKSKPWRKPKYGQQKYGQRKWGNR